MVDIVLVIENFLPVGSFIVFSLTNDFPFPREYTSKSFDEGHLLKSFLNRAANAAGEEETASEKQSSIVQFGSSTG